MREKSSQLIKSCGTRTDPAAETKSIGLPADPAFGEGRRSGALFFARHLDYFILTQNSHSSPGLGTVKTIYRDLKLIATCRDWQKTRHPDTDANSLNRRAVRWHSSQNQRLSRLENLS
jgi:hypothetical protein